jgi:hypothetical protein
MSWFLGKYESNTPETRSLRFEILNKIQNVEVVIPKEQLADFLELTALNNQSLYLHFPPANYGKYTGRLLKIKSSFSDKSYILSQNDVEFIKKDLEGEVVHLYDHYAAKDNTRECQPRSLDLRKIEFDWESTF